jgi:hypothetical protein
MSEQQITRRDAIKRAAYMAPVILTVLAAPSFASAGSGSAPSAESESAPSAESGSAGFGKPKDKPRKIK